MKIRTFEEQNPSRVLMQSPSTWSGLPFAHLYCEPIEFLRRGVSDTPNLILTVKGRTKVKWRAGRDDFELLAQSGSLIYLDRDFELQNLSNDGVHEVLKLGLDPRKVEHLVGEDYSAQTLFSQHLPRHVLDEDPHVEALMYGLASEIRNGSPSGALYAQSISLAVVSYFWGKHSVRHSIRASTGLSPSKLAAVKDFIRSNIDQDVSLLGLAGIAGLSPKHLCRCFKEVTGESPYQYLLGVRIDEAKRLLRASDMPITEVALSTGFSALSHFSTAFRKATGLSPREFRLNF